MAEKKKPQEDLVAVAARAMKNPETLKGSDIKRMAARILDDQRNDPEPNAAKPSLTSKVVAAVSELLPATVGGTDKAKPAKAKDVPPAKAKEAPPAKMTSADKPAPAPVAKAKPAAKAPTAPAAVKVTAAAPAGKTSAEKPKPAAKAKGAPKG